jgi:hypothetical protein
VALLTVLMVRRSLLEPLAAVDPTGANRDLTRGQDFRDALYFPIKELLRGGDPYDPASMFARWPVRQEFDLYAPFHLLLNLPYTLLPYRAALIVFSCVSVGCLLGIGLVSARVLRLPGGWLSAWVVAACVVGAQIGKSVVYFGQIDPLVGLGGVLALLFVGRSTGWAALGLALTWIKPQFGIPLTLVLLFRGAWRPALAGTLGAGLASLPVVGVLVVREGGVGGFVDVVRANLAYASSTGYAAVDSPGGARVDVAAVFFRLTGWLPPLAEGIVFVTVLGLAGWLLSGRPRRGTPFDTRELFVASLGALVGIVKQQSESLITVPALVGVVVLLLSLRTPASGSVRGSVRGSMRARGLSWPVLAAAALTCVPVVHISFVEQLLKRTVGDHVDSLVEGVSLIVAFALVCAASVGHRDDPPDAGVVN